MKLQALIAFSFFFFVEHAFCQQANVDSLGKALTVVRADTVKMSILSDLCFAMVSSNPDSALYYAQEEMSIARRAKMPKYTATAFNDVAIVLYYKGDYSNALTNNEEALKIRQGLGDPQLVISSLNKIAVIYQEQGKYEKATEIQLQVLKLAVGLHNDAYIGATLNNLSNLLLKVKKYDQAMAYSQRALAIARSNKDSVQMAADYAAIETIFEQNGKPDSARYYQAMVIYLLQQTNSLPDLSHAYNDMGYLYRLLHKDDSGLYYYKRALELATALDSKSDMAFYAANAGATYIDLKKTDSGCVLLRRALLLNSDNSRPEILKIAYDGLATYFILKNKPDSALHYNRLYKNVSDTIYSATTARQVNELLSKYESEQKENQIALLGRQNTIKQLTIQQRNIAIGIIAGVFVVSVVLGLLFYNRYRMRQDAKMQDELMQQQQLTSRAVLTAEELERKRIAGDLHDGIGQMFSAVKMNLSGISDRVTISSEDRQLLDKTLALVDESCKEVRVISHQMMPNVLLKSGLSAAIRDFIDKIDENKLKIRLETFGLQQALDSNVETVLYRVIQESVNNVIKHAKATTLDIQLHKDDDGITATIEDNGTGFDMPNINEDKSIGLKSIRARVAFLGGKVDYDTAPGRGTLVAIFIPGKQQI